LFSPRPQARATRQKAFIALEMWRRSLRDRAQIKPISRSGHAGVQAMTALRRLVSVCAARTGTSTR
jgi:hypothetical protein